MPEFVRRVSCAVACMLALGVVGCAAPASEPEPIEPFEVADDSDVGGMAGQGAVPDEAEQTDDVQANSQSLTFTGRVPYTCDPPDNGMCVGIYGRVCHYRGKSWCQVWKCGLNGCSWQLP